MFLTTCAVCAKALNNDEARECEKCGTRFCGETCENEHRAQAKICDDTAEDGGAELIHINQKGKKAWEHAVSSCAEEAAGKTCYICMEILDGDGDNCVRGCACRGDPAGFAHLTCLAQQALGIMQARIAASSDPRILTRRTTRRHLRKQRRRSPKGTLRE